jgi:hypothetical protein
MRRSLFFFGSKETWGAAGAAAGLAAGGLVGVSAVAGPEARRRVRVRSQKEPRADTDLSMRRLLSIGSIRPGGLRRGRRHIVANDPLQVEAADYRSGTRGVKEVREWRL